MSELNYEPRVILAHAARLNRRADSMGMTSAIIGAVIGGFFGAVPLTSLGDSWPIPHQFGFGTLLAGILLGALTGYVIGDARAFGYRLQAQSSLCQLHLERNTAALLEDSYNALALARPEPRVAPVVEFAAPEPEPAPFVAAPVVEYVEPEPEPAPWFEPEPAPSIEVEPAPLIEEHFSAYLKSAPDLEPEPEPVPEPAPVVAALVPEYVEPEPEPEPVPAPFVDAPAPDLDSMSLEQIAHLAKTGQI